MKDEIIAQLKQQMSNLREERDALVVTEFREGKKVRYIKDADRSYMIKKQMIEVIDAMGDIILEDVLIGLGKNKGK